MGNWTAQLHGMWVAKEAGFISRSGCCPPPPWGFPSGPVAKKPPTMRETWVPSLGREDPLKEGMATQSSILA